MSSHRFAERRRFMTWRCWRAVVTASIAMLAAGCGGPATPGSGVDRATGPEVGAAPARSTVLVGFDASEPALNAMAQGKVQGIVLQSPFKMGMLGVKTM